MVRTVIEHSGKTNNGITCKGTLKDTFAKTLLDCGEEALGNAAANNALAEL